MLLSPSTGKAHRATDGEVLEFLLVYLILYNALCDAKVRGLCPHELPTPWLDLQRSGVTDGAALWLQYQGHVVHLRSAGPAARAFLSANSLLLSDLSFLALTARGDSFASEFLAAICFPNDDREFREARDGLWCGELKPRYDGNEGVFSWGCHLLKHFRQPAWKQRLILTSAEELAWPAWFDDPLPLTPGINPKIRLHDAIKDLNRRQQHQFVHFKGDGTGRRIGWDLQ